MTALDNIVNVTITRDTQVPTRQGFGTANFLSTNATFAPRIKSYGSIDEVVADTDVGNDSINFANAYFGQEIRPSLLYVTKKDVDTISDALDDAQNQNDKWYAVAQASRNAADLTELATWTQSRVKIAGLVSADADITDPLDNADIASSLKSAGFDRSFLIYKSDGSSSFAEGAWLGLQLPKNPGSTNWSYQTLAGVNVDNLTISQSNAVLDKNANIYTEIAGLNLTQNGKMSGNEWIDIIRGSDWIQARIKEDVFSQLVNSEKIPYTDAGIQQIVSAVRNVLRQATTNGILAADPEFEVNAPLAANVSMVDKGNRVLPDVFFTGTLAGAINKTIIQGRLVL